MKQRKFTSGTALIVMLSMGRHSSAEASAMRHEIEGVTGVKLGNAGIIAVLNNLVTWEYATRKQVERVGSLKRGEHGKVYNYALTAIGKDHIKWMLNNIDQLRLSDVSAYGTN